MAVGLMAFNLDDYEPVAARLARFLEAHPDGRVITDLVHYSDERCVFRCDLYLNTTLIANGWAEETRGEGHINRSSHLENCETGAVGRALANAGYAGSDPAKRASREEMSKVQRAQPGTAARPMDSGKGFATPKQIGFIKALARGKELDDVATLELLHATLGTADVVIETLTAAQASQVIEAWKS
jgi:hypothetical protein